VRIVETLILSTFNKLGLSNLKEELKILELLLEIRQVNFGNQVRNGMETIVLMIKQLSLEMMYQILQLKELKSLN